MYNPFRYNTNTGQTGRKGLHEHCRSPQMNPNPSPNSNPNPNPNRSSTVICGVQADRAEIRFNVARQNACMVTPFFQQINHRQHPSLTSERLCVQQCYRSHRLYMRIKYCRGFKDCFRILRFDEAAILCKFEIN